jgi:hypothetical protein
VVGKSVLSLKRQEDDAATYVFVREGNTWKHHVYFKGGDGFGEQVAIDQYIVVNDNSGDATSLLYTKTNQLSQLLASEKLMP